MFKFPFVVIALLFIFFSIRLSAVEVTDLYQATVVVDSQASNERSQAMKTALQGVFLKVGGKQSVLTHHVLQRAQNKAASYVSQYRYQRVDGQLSLVVSFNENKVNQLFEQAQLALWGSLRPQVLLWLIDEQGITRNIIAHDADSPLPTTAAEFSTHRGLPMMMPLMDLTDTEHVVVDDFWEYIPDKIQSASQRYGADTIVVMRISDSSLLPQTMNNTVDSIDVDINSAISAANTDPNINDITEENSLTPKVLDWRVYTQGALYTQQYIGTDKLALMNQGLSDITELIYQSYALLTSAEDDFVIEVQNVTSLVHDTKLFSFLKNLSAVKTVVLIKAEGDERQFKVDLLGSKASFLASLKLNRKLTQIIEPQFSDLADTIIPDPVLNDNGVQEPLDDTETIVGIYSDIEDASENNDFNDGNSYNTEINLDEVQDVDSSEITNTNNTENNVEGMHYGMKVIVLGEPLVAIDTEIQTDTTNTNVDNNNDENEFSDSDGASDDGISENDAPVEPALLKPLQPSIPVFYWEQG